MINQTSIYGTSTIITHAVLAPKLDAQPSSLGRACLLTNPQIRVLGNPERDVFSCVTDILLLDPLANLATTLGTRLAARKASAEPIYDQLFVARIQITLRKVSTVLSLCTVAYLLCTTHPLAAIFLGLPAATIVNFCLCVHTSKTKFRI